ncbi:hypothetical protein C1H46_003283 [Malus baccata]|uniref:Uncharacterized protein n=1 Tax=Malus baccata TaxID=106549 RepID=A0A540NJP5_MALBA|nr:hypothetical protein C1H46_003283 [Malus baccata]
MRSALGVLERRPRGDKDGHDRCISKLMKLMDEALKRGYKQWHYDVERNGGPAKQ